MTEARRFRVFVSSPSDVFGERERIERVIDRLNGELGGGTELQAIRWEHTYYTADKTFQDQIILPSQTDLVICILWKRLGAELPPDYRRPDGTTPTGTEYEFEEAIQAAKAKGTPDVLVYRKTAAVMLDAEHIDLERAQFEALKRFWTHWFQNETGHFTAAYESFETTDQFEALVEDHLRQWLARNKADIAATATWSIALKGSPFRGLRPFDEAHAEVFFGRRRVVEQAREKLIEADRRGSPFLLLLGMSGSGKSSLARAGLVPRLTQIGAVPGIDLWRRCVIRPGEAGGDPLLGLARALYRTDVLPELGSGDCPVPDDYAALLRSAPDAAARAVRLALSRAGKAVAGREGFDRPVTGRLLLVVDQFEEALAVAPESREAFGAALTALVTLGQTWVVGTLRSDLYPAFQASQTLVALRERGVLLDLLPPTGSEIAEIVTGPAAAAGLRFEARPDGTTLDEELVAAAHRPGSLPLLQLALDELFAARDPQSNLLGVAAYDAFGGLVGVVERRAEEALASLDPEATGALARVLAALVEVSDDGVVASRPTGRAPLAAVPGAERLIDAFVAARLLVVEDDHGVAGLRVAHDALITAWPRAQALIAADRDALRVRGRIEDAALRWTIENRHADFLLPAGRPLAEASDLLARRADLLAPAMAAFVVASQDAEAARQAALKAASERELRLQSEASHARAEGALRLVRRTQMAAMVVGLLLVVAAGAAGLAWYERGEAQRRALVAERNFTSAMALAGQMSNGAALASQKDYVKAISTYRDGLATVRAIGDRDPDASTWYVLKRANAQLHRSIGQMLALSGATGQGDDEMQSALDLFRAAAAGPEADNRQGDIVTTSQVFASALFLRGDQPGAVSRLRDGIASAAGAVARGAGGLDLADDLATSHRMVADMLFDTGDYPGALAAYAASAAIAAPQRDAHPDQSRWGAHIAAADQGTGYVLRKQGDIKGAQTRFESALAGYLALIAAAPDDLDAVHHADTAEQSVSLGLEMLGDMPGALEHATAALARGAALLDKNASSATWRIDVAISQTYVGSILKQMGRADEAKDHLDKASALLTKVSALGPAH